MATKTSLSNTGNNYKQRNSFKDGERLRVEEQFSLQDLQQLMKWFQQHVPKAVSPSTVSRLRPQQKMPVRQRGLLTLDEFKTTVAQVLGTNDYADQMDAFFFKLDTGCDGYVDWNEFCTYMLMQLRETDYLQGKKQIPFEDEAKIRHAVFNRQETTSKIVAVKNPSKYVSISKEGSINVWDQQLHFEKNYNVIDGEEDLARMQKRLVKEWVTDAVYMPNAHKIAISTTGRDIRFFDTTSSNNYFQEFHLFGLPNVCNCLTYWFDKKNISAESILIYGDDCGGIGFLYFLKPMQQLFEASFKRKQQELQKVYFPDLYLSHKWTRSMVINDVHQDIIRKIVYLPESNCIIASSINPRSSVVFLDILSKKKTYTFRISKGCECFDFNKNINILVTGSADYLVRLWNPYVTSKATAILEGHNMAVIDVIIHEGFEQVFSFARDAVLKVWDIKEQCCLQTITLRLPSSLLGRVLDFGPFPTLLVRGVNEKLLLAANDYLALLRIGRVATSGGHRPVTHAAPLCCAIFNPHFKWVLTGADDSSVCVWDLETGSKKMVFNGAHGNEEITYMTFDSSYKRLFTAARNGTVKVWNVQSGHNLQHLEPVGEEEVTGVIPIIDKKIIVTTGWQRLIVKYSYADPDNTNIKADKEWGGGQLHREDILCLAYCRPAGLLATASFDGQICIWILETEKLYVQLRCAKTATKIGKDSAFGKPRPVSRPSRPNSRHRPSHKPPDGQAAPVDKLLFLNERAKVKRTEAATLISSEAGVLRWWSIYGQQHELGHFYAPNGEEESVLAMSTTPDNSTLITGDTDGRIVIWDISGYCQKSQQLLVNDRPPKVQDWAGHDSAVVSIELVNHETGQYVLSASTDRTAKLWTDIGQCVGIFGQKDAWNLYNPLSWSHFSLEAVINSQSPILDKSDESESQGADAEEAKTEEKVEDNEVIPSTKPLDDGSSKFTKIAADEGKSERASALVVSNSNIPQMSLSIETAVNSETLDGTTNFSPYRVTVNSRSRASSSPKSASPDNNDPYYDSSGEGETSTMENLNASSEPSKGNVKSHPGSAMALPKITEGNTHVSTTCDIKDNKKNIRSQAEESTTTPKSQLGSKFDAHLVRVQNDRRARREALGELHDSSRYTSTMPKLMGRLNMPCYKSLAVADLASTDLPDDLPTSMKTQYSVYPAYLTQEGDYSQTEDRDLSTDLQAANQFADKLGHKDNSSNQSRKFSRFPEIPDNGKSVSYKTHS